MSRAIGLLSLKGEVRGKARNEKVILKKLDCSEQSKTATLRLAHYAV